MYARFCVRAMILGIMSWSVTDEAMAAIVTVTIDRVTELECFDEAGVVCASSADFYAVVTIGTETFTTEVVVDDDDISPAWVTQVITDIEGAFLPIKIEIFDSDFMPPDNQADLDPGGDLALDLELDALCDITGDVTATCGMTVVTQGTAPDHAEITFTIDAGPFDTDADGLDDRWEVYGIDSDRDGVIDFDLPALGVDPLRKDVLVEVDYMVDHLPNGRSLERAVKMFAVAPVANPDGSTGIDLHVHVDDEIPHVDEIKLFCDSDPATVDFADLEDTWFGTAAERLEGQAALDAKTQAFHYAIFGHDTVDGTAGLGELLGEDFAINLGSTYFLSPTGHQVGSMKEQAAVFVHELGHNLNLHHGGANDPINCKSNHVSVMNYSHTYSWIETPGSPLGRLDYSAEDLPDLDELDLDESLGIQDGPDTVYWINPGGQIASGRGDEPLDWDFDDVPNESGVAVDLNNRPLLWCPTSPGEILAGSDDWSNLALRFNLGPEFDVCDQLNDVALLEASPEVLLQGRQCAVNQSCEPRLLSFWQAQCDGTDTTEIDNYETYAACVSDIPTFAHVATATELCDELQFHGVDSCDEADAAYMALLLNRCSERVPLCCPADTTVPFGFPDEFVDDVIEKADDVLSDPFRTEATCDAALRELDLIEGGGDECGPDDLFGGWDNGTLAVGNVDTGIPALLATTSLVGITAVTWDPDQAALLVATGLGSDELWRVPVTDGVAGAPELIGALVYEDRLGGLVPLTELHAMEIAPEIASTFGFTPGDLYAVALDGPVGCDTNCGFFVDKDTAIATPAAQGMATEQLLGLSFDPLTGELWAYDDGPSVLYTLDADMVETLGPAVGNCVPGAVLSVLTASSLAHHCTGRLFTVDTASATLVEIDPLTGCGTLVGGRGTFRGKKVGPVRREGLGLDGGASVPNTE